MALVPCKGTVLAIAVAGGVEAALTQVIGIDVGEAKTQVYDATTLDQAGAGMEQRPTGYTEGGSITAEVFLDPAATGIGVITTALTTPAVPSGEDGLLQGTVTYADTGATDWTFITSGVGLGATVALNDGLKASLTFDVSGVIGY